MSKTFAKLREVSISYDLPEKILRNTFISKVTVSLVGRNLIYFYKDERFKDVDLDHIITRRRYRFTITHNPPTWV
jgi:hypothetical protein